MKTSQQLRSDEGFDRNFRQISGLTALSRLLGFIRDITFAQFLGAGPATDAFLVAFKLPNLFRRLTADGAMTNAFLPVFSSVRQQQGREAALILAAEVQVLLFLVLSAIVVVAEIFMPFVIGFLAPGFRQDPDLFAATTSLARITIPYLPMISLVALWAAVTNAHDRFFGGAAAPVILNIFLIAGALSIPVLSGPLQSWPVLGLLGGALAPDNPILALAMPICISVLIAGACQMALMQRMLGRIAARPVWQMPRLSDNSRKMWRAFLPAALGAGGLQLNLLIDMILASLVSVGAISWLYYADRIVQLPLGVIGIALGTALLPQLSKLESEKDTKAVGERLSHSLHIAAFFALPAACGVVIASDVIIAGLFGYGAFSKTDVLNAGMALAAYGLGLPAFVINKILQPAFFASDRGSFVLKISLLSVAVNIVASLLLMQVLGHVGLALATSLASWVGVLIMGALLVKEGRILITAFRPVLKILISAGLMTVMIALVFMLLPSYHQMTMGAVVHLCVILAVGLTSYFAIGHLLRIIPPFLFRRLRPSRKT